MMNSLHRYNNRPKLNQRKKIRYKLQKYRWELIIPFVLINILIIVQIFLQLGEGGL